jgi:hypothetical protein
MGYYPPELSVPPIYDGPQFRQTTVLYHRLAASTAARLYPDQPRCELARWLFRIHKLDVRTVADDVTSGCGWDAPSATDDNGRAAAGVQAQEHIVIVVPSYVLQSCELFHAANMARILAFAKSIHVFRCDDAAYLALTTATSPQGRWVHLAYLGRECRGAAWRPSDRDQWHLCIRTHCSFVG